MAGINDIFNIGRTGLLAFQQGIATTSHNITNQATKGYSRQEVNFVTNRPQGGLIPTGVQIAQIQRTVDQFIETQLTSTTEDLGRLQSRFEQLQLVEGIFTETDTIGISRDLDDLFNAFRDLSAFPEEGAIRTIVLNEARALADSLNQTSNRLTAQRASIDNVIGEHLIAINSFSSQIADLNSRIQLAEVGGDPANDLRDQRQVILNDLAEIIGIDVVEMPDGLTINVGGQLLVSGGHANTLVQELDADNDGANNMALKRDDNSTMVITQKITQGKIAGLLEVRDSEIVNALDRLDRLAGVVINEINQQHEAGYGLDGTTTNSLFGALTPSAPVPHDQNTGGAAGTSTTILTAASLTMDTYEIRFTNSTTFDVVNITDGTTVLSAQAYTSGANIDFDGLRAVVTNGAGVPAANDVFTLSGHKGAAADISVTLTDTDKLAASSTALGVPGNNVNALALVNIQTTTQSDLGNLTVGDYHAATIASVGSATADAASRLEAKQAEFDQLQGIRESVSGVNLDEELANLLSFQRAYEASARLITTADDLFQTVLLMGRR
jgi:flagellar hook-associated protein 1 FlgK